MIPNLQPENTINSDYWGFLNQLEKTDFSGEVKGDFATRLVTATDNSIYQILPQGVVYPRNHHDLVILLKLASQTPYQNITFSPRGGGTGTNGQSLSRGIIIDCSKFMNNILEINLEEGWVRVQPGVVLDQLNSCLQPHGVFFAPSVAPSNRATIGGMINTDACGKGSRIYGRTSQHILELTWVLPDGTESLSFPIDTIALNRLKKQGGRVGNIYNCLDDLLTDNQDKINQVFPQLTRFMTGYNLAKVYSEDKQTFNLNYLLAGAEGTLGIITEAKLKLTPIPQAKKLLVIHYESFNYALEGAMDLLASEPGAIETIDETILNLAKQDEIYDAVKDFIPSSGTINLVEFVGESEADIQPKIDSIIAKIQGGNQGISGYYLARDNQEIINLWKLRSKGAGLLGNQRGNRKPIPFIEDTVVPPVHLAKYIGELRGLLAEYHLIYGMYGHVDVGCLHLRPALDLKIPADAELVRKLSDRVVALVRQYGGVFWGEHGKGFRSEYTREFLGDELYQVFREVKTLFDPQNRLNPGKIVTPIDSLDTVVKLDSPMRGEFDRQVNPSKISEYEGAFNCNGNGACFNFDPDDVMCPSYRVTRDRIHSPKGRSSLLREWLRLLENHGDEITETPTTLIMRLWNTLKQWRGDYDYSQEVYGAMNGCLSCKACASQCPIHVNIPDMKSKFLYLYHTRYLRPFRDYLIAHIETLSKWQSLHPIIAHILSQNPLSKAATKTLLNIVDPPVVSHPTLKEGLRTRHHPKFNLDRLQNLSGSEKECSVILLQDAFTSFYESSLVLAIYDFLHKLGYNVYIPDFFPSGKPTHVKGFLREFKAIASQNCEWLQQLKSLEIPLIGIEPSIVLTYRDEYPKTLNFSQALPTIDLLQEFLSQNSDRLPKLSASQPYFLFGHCQEKTAVLTSQKQWQQLFTTMGLELNIVNTSCCGMAGIYGHEAEHYQQSQDIYNSSWGRIISTIDNPNQILVTGYSCRSQIHRFSHFTPNHPIQALLKLL